MYTPTPWAEYSFSPSLPPFITYALIEAIGDVCYRVVVEASHPSTGEFHRETVAVDLRSAHRAAAQLSAEIYTIAVRVCAGRGLLEELQAKGVFHAGSAVS